MRKDTNFSDKKLTAEEFSKKYWLNGEVPYQYHTGTIEDGRDEREQFLFNNVRSLYERQKRDRLRTNEKIGKVCLSVNEAEKKISILKKVDIAIAIVAILNFAITGKGGFRRIPTVKRSRKSKINKFNRIIRCFKICYVSKFF